MITNTSTTKACLILLGLGFFMPIPTLLGQRLERKDLGKSLSKYICNSKSHKSNFQIPEAVLDATLRVEVYKGLVRKEILKEKAVSLATKHRYFGYTFGKCARKGAPALSYAVATPLPYPLKKKYITKTEDFLEKNCRSYEVHLSHLDSPTVLKGKLKDIYTKTKAEETKELSCFPKVPRWKGPIVYALSFPREASKLWQQKIRSITLDGKNQKEMVLSISNKLRADWNIPQFKPSRELDRLADLASSNRDLAHDNRFVPKWLATSDNREKLNFKLLGENKAEASSISEAMYLFWISPAHKNLLVNQDADFMGVTVDHLQKGRKLVTLVVAKHLPTVLSTKPKGNAKESTRVF